MRAMVAFVTKGPEGRARAERPEQKRLGERLRILIEWRYESQNAFCTVEKGYSPSTVGSWCRGDTPPSTGELFYIAHLCGVDMRYFKPGETREPAAYRSKEAPGAWWFEEWRRRYKIAKAKSHKAAEKMLLEMRLCFDEEFDQIKNWLDQPE